MEISKKYSAIENIMNTILKNIEDYKSKHPEFYSDNLKLEVNIANKLKCGGKGFMISLKKGNSHHSSIILSEDNESRIFDVWEKSSDSHNDEENLLCTNDGGEMIRFTTNFIISKINKYLF